MPASLTIKEAAKQLGCCEATIRRLIQEDVKFPYIRISPRRIVIPFDLLARWVEAKALSRGDFA